MTNECRNDRVIAEFDRLILLTPKDAHAFTCRGHAYNNKDQHDRAIIDYGQAIKIDPKNADLFLFRGLAHRRRPGLTLHLTQSAHIVRKPLH